MKAFLIDTHVFLWWISSPEKLSKKTKNIIQDGSNAIYLSVACLWEMVIKKSKGKLTIPSDIEKIVEGENFKFLAIKPPHVLQIENSEQIHEDPFDRIQLAQAQVENLTFITKDNKCLQYPNISFMEA